MPKYPVLKASEIIKVLKKFWFKPVRQKWSHIQLKNIKTKKFTTIPSHPSTTVDPYLLKLILEQCDVSLEEFMKKL